MPIFLSLRVSVIIGLYLIPRAASLAVSASGQTIVGENYIITDQSHGETAGLSSALYNQDDQGHKYSKDGWHPTSEHLTTYDLPLTLTCDLSQPGEATLLEAYDQNTVRDALVGGYHLNRRHGIWGQNTKSKYMLDHGLDIHLFLKYTVHDDVVINSPKGDYPKKWWQYNQQVELNNATINHDYSPTVYHTCSW